MKWICPECRKNTVEEGALKWRDCKTCGWQENHPTTLAIAPKEKKRVFEFTATVKIRIDLDDDDVRRYYEDDTEVGPKSDPSDTMYETAAEGLAELSLIARQKVRHNNIMSIFDTIATKEVK